MNQVFKVIPGVFFLMFMGCAYNARETPADPCKQFQGASCDSTVGYTYSGQIGALMEDQGCNGCHESNSGDSPKLNTQADLIAYVSDCNNRAKFEAAINFTGNRPMPKGGDKLADSDLKKILNWICQGAKP